MSEGPTETPGPAEGPASSGSGPAPQPPPASQPGQGPSDAPGEGGADAGAGNGRAPEEMTVGELVFEVSDRASVLVREEIELAKTEVTEKFNNLLRGSVTAIAAGVFVLMALAMLMHGFAWLLNDLFFENSVYAGFLIEAVLFLIVAAIAGLVAKKLFEDSSPPTPDMAIEQAKEIKASFENGSETKEEAA